MLTDIQHSINDLASSPYAGNRWLHASLTILFLILLQQVVHHSLGRLVDRTVRRHHHTSQLEEHKRETTLKNFLRTSSTLVIWFVGTVLVLWELHVNFAALLTSAGVIGVIAGLGAQSLIKDCLAGLFIILENQLRVGDIVTIATPTGTVSGLVEEVDIRTTRLRDLDGNLHIITNGAIGIITNMSYNFAQVNVDINISYDTDIDLAEQLINQAGKATAGDKRFKADILEPIALLRVDKLGDSTVTLKALGKVKPGTQWDIAGDFRRRLKKLFDEHKIAAPYQTVNLHEFVPAKAPKKRKTTKP